MSRTTPETEVPAGETPTARCPYCDRPFTTERAHALHIGEAHRNEWTETEGKTYEQALDNESDELFVFHLQVVVALGLLYAGFVLAYMVVLA